MQRQNSYLTSFAHQQFNKGEEKYFFCFSHNVLFGQSFLHSIFFGIVYFNIDEKANGTYSFLGARVISSLMTS